MHLKCFALRGTTLLASALAALVTMPALARTHESEGQKFSVERIYKGDDVIWGFDFLSDKNTEQILFSERGGKLRVLDLRTGQASPVSGAPAVDARGQGGLLDVMKDHATGQIYLTYSEPVGQQATTSLYRGKLSADGRKLEGARLFQARALTNGSAHFGSRVVLAGDGKLFLSIGERNQRDKAQSLDNHHGKILRLDADGRAPADNPFVKTAGALPEIWSYGHRNPQGLFLDQGGVLLESEYGPRGGDEVNLVTKGANFGWPKATYGSEYSGPPIGQAAVAGTVQPLLHWVPSINPAGLMVYRGTAFPRFDGNLFIATMNGELHRIVFDGQRKLVKEEKLLADSGERMRQVRTGADGLIYVSTDSGQLFRLRPLENAGVR